jgi:NitT/TauT family transport system substrate-binding protein
MPCAAASPVAGPRLIRVLSIQGLSIVMTVALTLGLLVAGHGSAVAAETIRVVAPDRGAWNTSYTELGRQHGFFREQGLDVEISYVADEASLEKALISGEADIAVAAGFPDILAAWAGKAPIRIISPEETGAPDIFWVAKMDTAITSMQDLHGQAVGFSAPGALDHLVLLTLLREAGVDDARLLPIGAADNGMLMVLNFELQASWGGPLSAVKDLSSGEDRVIGRANDSPLVRNETVRVNVANANFLAGHRASVLGFLKAYKKSIDWAYSDPAALQAYAKLADVSVEFAKYIVNGFATKQAAQLDEIKGEDTALAQALASRRMAAPVTHDDIKGVYDLVLKDGS